MIGEALTEILIPSYDIELRRPYFFKRTKAIKTPECHNFPMKKVARATSAAPTYFEPLKLEIMT
jgi:patatin-like phospholipase/acyl hydrolase